MFSELDILRDVTAKFDKSGIQYMLTGSLAMSYYAQPRMTRDIDLVLEISPNVVTDFENVFKSEYYVSIDSIRDAIRNEFIFNLIHTESTIKVDCIIRKKSEFRKKEFERKQKVQLKDFDIFIVSKEDLIISKLFWIKESESGIQKADIKNLLKTGFDEEYLLHWINKLNLQNIFQAIKDE